MIFCSPYVPPSPTSPPLTLPVLLSTPLSARPASLAFVASGGTGSTKFVTPSGGGAITTIPINSTAGRLDPLATPTAALAHYAVRRWYHDQQCRFSTGYANPITPVSSTTTALTIPDGAPTNTLPDISFTAGASDKTALLSLGSAGGIVTIYSGDAVVGTSAFSCPTLSPAIFPFDIQ
ncbi:hypothetical protein CF328_g7656 [Tilletia controversa]|nr:hypothetical protein CF328_g7656 [Tilletia controversa]